MDVDAVRFLRSPRGEQALRDCRPLDVSDDSLLATLTGLRDRFDRNEAAAIVETLRLRAHAASKFDRAGEMLFDRDGLEQATDQVVSGHRAGRVARADPRLIVDLGCGIGGDAITLAGLAPVVLVDIEPTRVMMATHNVAVHGGRPLGVIARAEGRWRAAPLDVVFLDPARRSSTGRRLDPRDHRPPLSTAIDIARTARLGAIKTAPGLDHDHIPPDAEVEFVSHRGELKECVLWFGDGTSPGRRVASIAGRISLMSKDVPSEVAQSDPGAVIVEPDPAVIRAGLVQDLAETIDARMIDRDIAYLTLDSVPDTPFCRPYEVESWMPFQLKRLRAHLRSLDVGSVTVKKRGSAIDPDELRGRLRLEGTEHRVVILTRVAGEHVAVIARLPPDRDRRLPAVDPIERV